MVDKRDEIDEIDNALAERFAESASSHVPPSWDELFMPKKKVIDQYQDRRLITVMLIAAVMLCGLFLHQTSTSDTQPNKITTTPKGIVSTQVTPSNKDISIIIDNLSDNNDKDAYIEYASNNPTATKPTLQREAAETTKDSETTSEGINESPAEDNTKPTNTRAKNIQRTSDAKNTRHAYNIRDAKPKITKPSRRVIVALASSLSPSVKNSSSEIAMQSIPPITINIHSYHNSINFEGCKWKHYFPVNAMLTAKYEVYNNLYIGSGISYSYAKSTTQMVDRLTYKLTQDVNYIGIPLSVSYMFLDKTRFSIYGNISTMAEFNIKTNRTLESYSGNERVSSNSKEIKNRTPLLSLQAGVGIAYNMSDKVSIFGEPGVNLSFKNTSHIPSYKTESKYQFNFRFGFNFNL